MYNVSQIMYPDRRKELVCKAVSMQVAEQIVQSLSKVMGVHYDNFKIEPDVPTTGAPRGRYLERAMTISSKGGDRHNGYGHPIKNFSTIALMQNAYLKTRGLLAEGQNITPRDSVVFNLLQKIAREAESHKDDNWVDMAGYVNVMSLIHELQDEEEDISVDKLWINIT